MDDRRRDAASPAFAARMPPFGVASASRCSRASRVPADAGVGGMGLAAGCTRRRILVWRRADRWHLLGATLAGFGLAGLHAAWSLAQQLPPRRSAAIADQRSRVELPEHDARHTRFVFRVDDDPALPDSCAAGACACPGTTTTSRWRSRRFEVAAGSRWRFELRLRAPRGLRNPGGLDSEKHALAQRIAATGYVRDPQRARQLSPARGIDAWRERMSARIAAAVPQASSRFVRALALGDTRALDETDWETLRATGLTHLIAISGFHVGLVAGFFALLASGAVVAVSARWRGACRVRRRRRSRRCSAPCGYAAVAGFALPTVRTLLMIAVVVAACAVAAAAARWPTRWRWRRFAVLLVDPLAVLGAGFWLSFAGVAWLLWCLPHGAGSRSLQDFLSAQGVATLGLLPLSVVLFGQASLAGPFANLVAMPWWSLVVVPLSLLGTAPGRRCTPGAGGWAWRSAAWCFDLSWPLFERLGATAALALWWLPEPRWFALPLALLGAFWLLLPRGVPGKPLALLLWLPLLWPDRDLPRHGEAELVVIDVGQGLSVLVRTAHACAAVRHGAGGARMVSTPASARWCRRLHALGVRAARRVVVSHGDNDHAGGLEAVRRGIPPRPTSSRRKARRWRTPCHAWPGRRGDWDGVRFRFLHPPPHFPVPRQRSQLRAADRDRARRGPADRRHRRGGRARRCCGAIARRCAPMWSLVAHHGSARLVRSRLRRRDRRPPRPGVVRPRQPLRPPASRTSSQRWRAGRRRGPVDTAQRRRPAVRPERGRRRRSQSRRQAQPRLWDAARALGSGRAAGLSYRPD